jgi:branched-chain amino acid transport system permease protein
MATSLKARRLVLVTVTGVTLLGVLLAAPKVGGAYVTMLLAQALIYAVAAVSLDLVWGYSGIPDLGHSLWFGVGALVVGMMTTTVSESGAVLSVGGSPLTYGFAVALGMLSASAAAAIVAWYSFTRRSSHFYIAVVGLALAAIIPTIYSQFPAITGGEDGLFGFGWYDLSGEAWYFLSATILAVVLTFAHCIVRSDFGLLLRAVRDNEHRLRYLGFNVERIKIAIYAFGAAIAGFAGAVFACMTGAVSAPFFGFVFATEMLIWVALGGRGTIWGPAIGTIALSFVGSKLNASFPGEWHLLLGILFVLVVVFLPHGLVAPLAQWLGAIFADTGKQKCKRVLVPGFEKVHEAGENSTAIRINDLSFSYGDLHVLRGIDLEIRRGELLCMVGPNGAGKSTLIGVLTDGELRTSGRVDFLMSDDFRHDGQSPESIARRGIARKFQVPALFPSLTVAEHILLATANGRWPSLWRRTREIKVPPVVEAVCTASGLAGRMDDRADTLAHGFAQGLEMAMAVATSPRVVFMDEPTAGLTSHERSVVGEILRSLTASGITVVLIEHDLDFVEQVADRIAVLHDGQILETGIPADVVKSRIVRDAYLGSYDAESSLA